MAYINKNVNLLLMILVLVVLMSLVILTTVYQKNYRNLSASYDDTAAELDKVGENFSQKLQELNKATSELKIKSTDKEQLDTLYGTLTGEKEELDSQLSATRKKLQDTTEILSDTEKELSDAQYRIIKQDEEIAMLDSSVRNQKRKLDIQREEICDLNKQINADYSC